MKRTLLLFFSASIAFLTLSGYKNGASLGGVSVAVNGCNGTGGCHGTMSSATVATLYLIEKSSGDTVKDGKYSPGASYTVVATGTNASAAAFGFMLSSTEVAGSTQFGTFANPMPASNTKIQAFGGLSVFEHSSPITATAGAFSATADWTAPKPGQGDIRMGLFVNAVDLTNSTANDQWDEDVTVFKQGDNASVGDVTTLVSVTAYPNPARNVLNIDISNSNSNNYQYAIYAISGAVTATGNMTNSINSIDISDLQSGVHFLKVTDGNQHKVIRFNKL